MVLDRIALILVVIGALNWGVIGLFGLDLVAFVFGGDLPCDLCPGRPGRPVVRFPAVPGAGAQRSGRLISVSGPLPSPGRELRTAPFQVSHESSF